MLLGRGRGRRKLLGEKGGEISGGR
jgi:hypothetical protein